MTSTIENPKPEAPPTEEAYKIASSLLWQDRKFLLILYFLLVLPDLLNSTFVGTAQYMVALQITKRTLCLIFVFLVSVRWARFLCIQPMTYSLATLSRLMVFGFAFWFLFAVPTALMVVAPGNLQPLFVLLFIPAAVIALKYYFYFFPIVFNVKSVQKIISDTRAITANDTFVALRTMVSPMGAMLLLVALGQALAPDGRQIMVSCFADLFTGVYTLFSTYLSLAFCLVLTPHSAWRAYGLDPYREARLATLTLHGPALLSRLLRPKNGLIMLGMGILVWTANEMRAAEMLPAPTISIESVQAEDKLLRMNLYLIDEAYTFRGFYPAFFRLAGEKGTAIANFPSKIVINGQEQTGALSIPNDNVEMHLTLEFTTDRSAEELQALEDLLLWYRHAQIDWVDMKR
ncbi:hypothetical protein OAO01_01820 [Oligoflexia bacterium]|nr:hypothetical protein [Oligoflexia bacterium]